MLMKTIILVNSFLACALISLSQPYIPKITAYVGVLHPIVTYSDKPPSYNFKDYYVVGFPIGINYWKTSKVGLSFEFVPSIKTENKISKMNNFLFHPGIIVRLANGYTFAGRAAFETSGRFGFTPVLNKTLIERKNCKYYVALSVPTRFGNDVSASETIALQFGIGF